MSFRIGIIGCGNIANVHATALLGMPEIEIVGCADIRPAQAAALAIRTGGRVYSSLENLLEAEKPDAVHLCTPHHLHAPMTVLAAKHGTAVFTEKPACISRTQWEQMKKAARRVPVGVCFQNRYNPNVLAAEKLIAEGKYGRLIGARAFVTWNRGPGYYSDAWHGKLATEGGGVLINQAVHTLDLLLRFFGKPDRICSCVRTHRLQGIIEVEDTAEIYLEAGDRRGILFATNGYTRDAAPLIELQLEKACLTLEEDRLRIVSAEGERTEICPDDPKLGKSYWGAGHRKCIADFYHCLKTGEPFRNELLSCENVTETLLTVYEQNGLILPKKRL